MYETPDVKIYSLYLESYICTSIKELNEQQIIDEFDNKGDEEFSFDE